MTQRDESAMELSVLGFFDDAEQAWTALALEMDLRGYGETFEEAMSELEELVRMQIRFARQKNQPELIWFPADHLAP